MQFDPSYPELLVDLATELRRLFVERGMEVGPAEQAARNAAEHVRQHWGGQLLYIPRGTAAAAMKRAEEIWSKFRGDNMKELAREYECSEMAIRRILSKVRTLKRRAAK